MTRRLLAAIGLVLAIACRDTNIIIPQPTQPTATPSSATPVPTNPATPVTPTTGTAHRFEFRVGGNASLARIVYSSPSDGALQVVTALPYSTTLSSTETSVFLSLDVTPLAFASTVLYPFVSVQIVVDGVMFREATLTDVGTYPISVSGTWRAATATPTKVVASR